ncbi:hypothetical protein ACIOGZ_29915 [Kitasatospora sp. NPDC088160]|uniref:hypothetical protein n=1 Tax=Kitasatospora sp. NPDC088160 TaxID=3364072 RepID=UPI0037F6DCD5
MSADPAAFAWCFDHGRLHRFAADDEPWCTAAWVSLPGGSADEALKAKHERFGNAVFFDHLPSEQQLALVNISRDTH